MKRLKPILALLFGVLIAAPLSGQEKDDKIGTVNMQQLLADYFKFAQNKETFMGYEKGILAKDQVRVESIKALVKESQDIAKEAESSSITREQKEELFQKAGALNREAQALQNERIAWLNRKKAAFNEKQAVELGILRKEIMVMVKEIGDAQEFDFIFDRSGSSGASIPILSYAKDATDLTPLLLERINRDAPPEDVEKPGEEEPNEEKPATEGSGE